MSDFTARINAILDTRQADAQMSAFQSRNNQLDIRVNLIGANANINNILNQMRTLGGNAGNQFSNAFNSSLNRINVRTGMSEIQNLQRTLKSLKFDHSSIDAITRDLNEMSLAVSNVTTRMNGQNLQVRVQGLDELGRAVTIVKEFDSTTGRVLPRTSQTISQSFGQVEASVARMANSIRTQMNAGGIESSISRVTLQYEKLGATGHARLSQIQTDIATLNTLQTSLANSTSDDDLVANYERFSQTLQRVRNNLTLVASESKAMASSLQIKNLDNKMSTWMTKNSRASKQFGATVAQLRQQLNNLGANATISDLKRIETQFKNIDATAKQMGLTGKTFGDTFKSAFTSIAKYVSVSTVLYQSINAIKQMFNNVVEVDTAMTELKKVTNETAESYDRFLSGAGKTAKEIGTTVTGIVSSTADFSRLGYDFADAQELAKVANIYAVVGDEVESVDVATQSLVSTMAAFGEEVTALEVIDKFNEVGNNFAISSGGIGDALTRSASSMAAANNSLDETIALITAANTVVQDPDSVGTAFKTISMRIRGATTELEAAGLETDGMASSTAKLREEIMALSGVDIMLDETTFKSTYDIMDELSKKWGELTDIQQASITELIAGKRQGNIVSSLMENFDIARDALDTSLGSEGSAMAEHEKWMESLEAKINQLKASWQELSMAFMNDKFLKGLVDSATNLLNVITKVVDTFGTLPTILGAVAAGLTFKNVGIFKMIEDDATKTGLRIQNTFSQIFSSFKNTPSFSFSSNFASQLTNDGIALTNYRNAVLAGTAPTTAFSQTMANASQIAQDYARNTDVLQMSFNDFKNQCRMQDVTLQASNKSFGNVKTLLNEYNTGLKNCKLSQSDFISAVGKSNGALGKYLSGLNGADATMKGYVTSLIKGKIATIGMQAATIALNAALSIGVSMAISGVISLFSKLANAQKEARESALEVGNSARQEAQNITKLYNAYYQANSAYNSNTGSKETLTSATDALLSALGLEQAEIQGLINEYGSLDAAINQVSIDSLKNKLTDMTSGYHAAVQTLMETTRNSFMNGDFAEIDFVDAEGLFSDVVKDAGFDVKDIFNYDSGFGSEYVSSSIDFGDTSTLEGIVEMYDKLVGVKEALEAQIGIAYDREEMTQSSLFNAVSNKLNSFSTEYEEVLGYIDEVNATVAQIEIQEAINTDGLPQTQAEFDALAQSIQNSASASGQFIGTQEQINNSIINTLATFPELEGFVGSYTESLNEIATAASLAENLSIEIPGDDKFENSVNTYIEKVESLKSALSEYQSGNFSNDSLNKLLKDFPELADQTDNLDSAIINLLGGLNNDMLSGFSSQFGKVDTTEDIAALEAFQSAVLSLGSVVGNTEFSIDISTESSGMENLFTAMKESVTSTGLTSESITNLKARYQDLEDYDAARLFEKTANGVHLNTRALRELESAYESQKKNEIHNELDSLLVEYNSLTGQIDNCSDAAQRAQLYAKRADILDQINDTSILAAQYEGLTSAFYKWEQAQSIGEEGDMYDSLAGGLKDIKELYDEGLVGTNKFRTAVQLMSNEDLSTANVEQLMQAYEDGYSKMKRYFQDSSDGCLNFLNDVQDLNSEWVSMNEDGSWDINFGMGNDQEIADALGINVESVQSIMRKLSDYGFDINLDSMYSSLDYLQTEAEIANNKLMELGKTDYVFNFNTDDIDNINEQIEVAKSTLDQFKNEDGKVNLSIDGAEEAQTILEALIYQKQSLDKAAILSVDTSNASSEIENVIAKLQEFKGSYNNLEVQTEIGADTTKAKQDVDNALNELSSEHAKILAELGIDTTSADAAIASINALTPEVMVKCGLDATLVEGYQAAEHTTEGTVIWDNNIDKVTAWIRKKHQANGTVNWDDNVRNVKTHFTATGTINWSGKPGGASGTAYAKGTAKAKGDWGTKSSGVALGGELGQELVVRDGKFFTIGDTSAEFFQYKKGDIIFNHKQTKEIFEKGRIDSVAPRGKVFAQGTAFSNGTGTITAKGKVKTKASSKNKNSKNSKSDKDDVEVIDWIEIAIERVERAIKRLSVTASSSFKKLSTRLSKTDKQIAKVNDEIDLQQDAKDKYLQKANSVDLSSGLKKKVREGKIDITEYSGDTAEAIKEYQEWYEKALACSDAIQELKENLGELYSDKFNMIATDFENKLSTLEHMTNTYENGIEQLEAKGYLGSKKYYEAMKEVEMQNISTLEKELDSLTTAMSEAVNSGAIAVGSEAWYEMQNEINATKEEIQEANTAVLELNNSIRELEWETFDFLQERVSSLVKESEFMIELLSNSDLHDDKGNLTDEGLTTVGLHGQNYNTYMSQADQYAKEIEEINSQIANDPNDTKLIERREELLELQRESILAAEDEKQAIIDLVEEGIQIELDSLKDLIDAYTDSLDSAKDLYDYQKKIKNQTGEIASLQKQLEAYKNDTSEEGRAKSQKISVDLADAIEELEETEYEHYISEQKKLLDNLYNEYEQILNERLDNVDLLLEDMINSVNTNSETIKTTLETESGKVGYTITEGMKSVWANEGGANAIITKYGDGFSTQITSLNTVLTAIAQKVGAMTEESDEEADDVVDDTTPTTPVTPTTPPSTPADDGKDDDKKDDTPKEKPIKKGGKIKASGAKIYDYKGDKSGERQYFRKDPIYKVLAIDGNWLKVRHHKLKKGVTGWFKKKDVKAYKTGGLVDYTGLAQLDGTPRKPELVLNAKDTQNFLALKDSLRNMAEKKISIDGNNSDLIPLINGLARIIPEIKGMSDVSDYLASIAEFSHNMQSINVGDIKNEINVPIDHVGDYNDFVNKLRQDGKFEDLIESMTIDKMFGGSRYAKNKYKW